ncbi:MAG: segregation/condensation protein A [Legionellaceae bacterium]|nr:segregation/condensation protein A [Legionellaceae bacterium]HCA89636.1 segregation/condensation protein A [Legionellales bacterium]|tara:strand:- start:105 stop:887 length:783 start_codon:yes stop_codon:yes gene_type:complete
MSVDFVVQVKGQPYTKLPKDLFIPPQALEVFLETFTGPLDVLLYLIRRQNLDIFDIPIVLITKQYMQYIQLLNETTRELAADYMVMAALLTEIKSRLLLPVPANIHDDKSDSIDPRQSLADKLHRYEQFKTASLALNNRPQLGRDVFAVYLPLLNRPKVLPKLDLEELKNVWQIFITRQKLTTPHIVKPAVFSVKAAMARVLKRLDQNSSIYLTHLLVKHEGRLGVVACVLAILELAKTSIILTQDAAFAPIILKLKPAL